MMGIPISEIANVMGAKDSASEQGAGRSTMFGLPALSAPAEDEPDDASHTQRYTDQSVGSTAPSGFPALTRDALNQALSEESSEPDDRGTQVMGSFSDIQKMGQIDPPTSAPNNDFARRTTTGARPFATIDDEDAEGAPELGRASVDEVSPHGTLMGMSLDDIQSYQASREETPGSSPEETSGRSTMFSFPSPFTGNSGDEVSEAQAPEIPAAPKLNLSGVSSPESPASSSDRLNALIDAHEQEAPLEGRNTMFGIPAMSAPDAAADMGSEQPGDAPSKPFDSSYSLTSDAMDDELASTSILSPSALSFESDLRSQAASTPPSIPTSTPAPEAASSAPAAQADAPAPSVKPAVPTPRLDLESFEPPSTPAPTPTAERAAAPTPEPARPHTPTPAPTPRPAPPMPASTGPRPSNLSPMEQLGRIDTSVEPKDPGMSFAHRGIMVVASSLFVVSSITGFAFTVGGGVITTLILLVPLLLAAIGAGSLFVPRSLRRWMLGVVAAIGVFVVALAMIQAVTLVSTVLAVLAVMLVLVSIGLSLL